MPEQPNTTPEDGEVELVATVTFRWTYMAKPSDYGTSDPLAMAKIDTENYRNDPLMYVEGEPAVTVGQSGKQRVDVVLTKVGQQKLNVIKEVRWAIPGLELRSALQLVEAAPVAVREDIYAGDATAIVNALRAVGATVELRPHAAPSTAEQPA